MIPLIALAVYGVGVAVCYGIMIMIFQTENVRDRIMTALLWPAVLLVGMALLLTIGFTGLFGGGHHD